MSELDGRVAIVTGAGRGIGEQVARKLAAQGATVVVSDRDGDEATAVAESLPNGSSAHVGDLTARGVCEDLVESAVGAHGRLDVIVNNAGYAWDAPVHKVTDEQWEAMIAIHTTVPFRVLRAAAPHLRGPAKAEREAGDEVFRKVVNVASLAGVFGNAGQAAYAAAKGGVIGLTRALAKEWGGHKINVNAVAFGVIDTRLLDSIPDAGRAAFATAIPVGRPATAEEAARGVYVLCSPASDYIHGQVLNVSGGLALGMAG
jgi:3-oxoacyl-[acyl-carrier protein] reductase